MTSPDVISILAAVFSLRCFPFVLAALFQRELRWQLKCGALLVYAVPVALLLRGQGDDALMWLAAVALAYAYFAASTLAWRAISGLPWARSLGGAAWMLGSAVAYVLIPGLLTSGPVRISVTLIGWEMMFSAYSLAMAVQRGNPCSKATALWFILVDPSLVFDQRARVHSEGESRASLHGLWRALAGISLLSTHYSIVAWVAPTLARLLPTISPFEIDSASEYAQWLGRSSAEIITLYAGHSGLAALHVGLMSLLGYTLPERYRFPLSAKDPSDFWRRWNSYLGAWLKLYVFSPAIRMFHRLGPAVPSPLRRATVLFWTLGLCGLAHELAIAIHEPENDGRMVLAFLFGGLVAVIWPFPRGLDTISQPPSRFALWRPAVQRLLMWHLMCFFVWLALPST